MGGLLGGKSQKEAQRKAEEQARRSREMQEVQNNRQLAEMQMKEQAQAPTRKKVRGRALFTDFDDSNSKLA